MSVAMQMQTDGAVYADVLFLINFSMDFLCFYITARLRSRRIRLWRTGIAAAIGGVYSVAALFVDGSRILSLAAAFGVLVIMCAVAESDRGGCVKSLMGAASMFFIVSSLLGGLMTALYSLINESEFGKELAAGGADSAEDDLSVWLLALLAAASAAATLIGGRRWRMHTASRQGEMTVIFEGRTVTVRGMTDTGNFLTDPLSGRPVVLCELDAVEKLFPKELSDFWRNSNISGAGALPPELAARLRFIPASGALGADGTVIAAIKPDLTYIVPDEVPGEKGTDKCSKNGKHGDCRKKQRTESWGRYENGVGTDRYKSKGIKSNGSCAPNFRNDKVDRSGSVVKIDGNWKPQEVVHRQADVKEGVNADVLLAPIPRRLSAGGSRALFPPGII